MCTNPSGYVILYSETNQRNMRLTMWNTYAVHFYSAEHNKFQVLGVNANSANEAELKALVDADMLQLDMSFIVVKVERITNNTEESI